MATYPSGVYLQNVIVILVVIQALATRLGLWENYPSAVHNQTKVPFLVICIICRIKGKVNNPREGKI
jgi:hypothetical protein